MPKMKTDAQFLKELSEKNSQVISLEAYKGAREQINFKCVRCGYVFKTTPDSVLRGSKCAKCSGILRKNQSQFEKEVKLINPKIIIIGKYINNRTKIDCRCSRCNHTWPAIPSSLLSGSNCPNCSHGGTSYIEQCIYILLCDIFGEKNVQNRNRKIIGKELDIYIPKIQSAIEFGSWFWHKNKLSNDIEKINKCKEKNIELLVIYDCFQEKNEINDKNIWVYKENMTNEKANTHIALLERILVWLGLYKKISYNYYCNIRKRAYERSSRKTTEEFQEQINKINKNIMLLEPYTAARKKIKCRCSICNHEWNPFADNLIRGQGCPDCARKKNAELQKITNREFIKKVKKKINPNVEILSEYIDSKTPIKCKCKKCFNEWNTKPGNLYSGCGCPKCGGTTKKTNEEFIYEMSKINSNIEFLEEYRGNRKPIRSRCKKCGYIWNPRTGHLLSKHGCPMCCGNLKKQISDLQKKIDKKMLNVTIIGEYINSEKPLLFKCDNCGYEWSQLFKTLIKSRGCKKCFPYTEKQDEKWYLYYSKAKKYYEIHGNIDIKTRELYDGLKLGSWIYSQKESYRNMLLPDSKKNKSIGNISQKRIDLLNILNIKW